MAAKNDRPSPVRPFRRKAKKRTAHPYLAFGTALAVLRMRTGKKQCEVAGEAGITKGMLSSYETGRQRPSLESLTKLLKVLGADFRDLQDTLDSASQRSLQGAGGSLLQWEPADEEMDRERRIGRAVLDVVAAYGEARRESSAPQLRIVGSIGSRRRAG